MIDPCSFKSALDVLAGCVAGFFSPLGRRDTLDATVLASAKEGGETA